ncbi:hypothetical protein L873DRAFT_769094 [Choiromyces venosus 120613-1]|uniref:Secreted protein n=1 Tax=Choiromyces venosus 120613-1 TaxID=1336337 RepID=A0A3N4IX80_9PEZI|nr:hypothetical protein L873DRAFT_769094 [Choiromyces venosus 120613-1]
MHCFFFFSSSFIFYLLFSDVIIADEQPVYKCKGISFISFISFILSIYFFSSFAVESCIVVFKPHGITSTLTSHLRP